MYCDICGCILHQVTGTMTTLVGYFSPLGHNHDDNCRTRLYACENGHRYEISKRNKCPALGCGWKGKERCFCHKGAKVDEWPDQEVPKFEGGSKQ